MRCTAVEKNHEIKTSLETYTWVILKPRIYFRKSEESRVADYDHNQCRQFC